MLTIRRANRVEWWSGENFWVLTAHDKLRSFHHHRYYDDHYRKFRCSMLLIPDERVRNITDPWPFSSFTEDPLGMHPFRADDGYDRAPFWNHDWRGAKA